jgi:bifunctional DNA-binding transcriptional regulator/antitoxin component of YhaV-PrlF toxin-antitoxin module
MQTTVLSSRGRVLIPTQLLHSLSWAAGTALEVEPTERGLLIRPTQRLFSPTHIDEVMGCAAYSGPTLTDKDIAVALDREMSVTGKAVRALPPSAR